MSDLEKFDMFKFGQLVNQVETLQVQVNSMDKDIKELLELANKGKGGFWAGMAIVSAASSAVGYFINLIHK